MANRFPIIVDSSGVPALKELASGDNLDLTGSGIVNAGTVAVNNLIVGGNQGTNGQTLQSTGSGVAWADAAGGGGAWNVISSQTVSSAVSSVSFTSGITGYDSYVLMMHDIEATGTYGRLYAKFAYNGSSSLATAGYTHLRLTANTFSPAMQFDIDGNQSNGIKLANSIDASLPANGRMWFNAGSSLVGSEFTYLHYGAYPFIDHTAGYNQNSSLIATSINQIQLYIHNGNIASGTFTLYGLANS